MIINAKQFAEKTGFLLAMIRRLCRIGVLAHWRSGRVYLLDEDKAMRTMETLKEQLPSYNYYPETACRRRKGYSSTSVFSSGMSYHERIQQMKKENREQKQE